MHLQPNQTDSMKYTLRTAVRFTGSLGLRESPSGPAKSRATEATDISQGHRVTGPLGKSWWPGKVPGYWGHWHFSGSRGHWAFRNVLVARQGPGPLRPLTFFRVTGSLVLRESASGPAKSQAAEATDISQGHLITGPTRKCQRPGILE